MARSKTSKAWMREHVNDTYVQRAKAEGYRSRAAFKIIEIDAKDRLFRPGQIVVDLGATPGGWAQVAATKVGPKGRVIALDLLEMAPLPGVTFLQGDFSEEETLKSVEKELAGAKVDVVISDMSPNISGIGMSDQARSIHLSELALEFAVNHLQPEGSFVVKVFQGAGFEELLRVIRSEFESVVSRKPEASRGRSSEMYLLARRLRRNT
ncbi:MAG TPA: RlmE family RNA methyltransferase [Burkholderiales bacterium]|nr:RlmE family RNA methyltransferase [Burkholderiales bacterium]